MTVILAQIGVGVAEIFYIGRLGTSALAGASLVFPFYMLMTTMSAGGLGSGIASAVARAIGAGRTEQVQRIFAHAVLTALAVGLAFTIIMIAAASWLYASLGGEGAVHDAALTYSNIVFAGVTFLWISNLLGAAFRGMGNAMLPARIALIGAAFLIPVSPALIFGFGPIPAMGIGGAGLAIILYQAGATLALLVFWRKTQAAAGSIDFRPDRAIFADILRVGVPSSLNALQASLMSVVLTGLAARFGDDALAAYGIASRLDSMMVPVLFGLASAVLTMVGMNAGAGNIARAGRIAWTGAAAGMVVTGLPGILFAIWPQLWLGLFSADPAVLAEGSAYLHITGPFYPAMALGFILSFAAQGAGHSFWPTVAVTARLLCAVGLGWIAIVTLGLGFAALGVATATGVVAYGIICALAMRSGAVWHGQPRRQGRSR
ncbi:MATE family efflux transporter [Niveispirillum sp. BGYR6]|uniref:MATE family efflux transporter n=1 Tax=Niveispirillum sp. BGYR6 TaxID=2971249 RepID=UPI0022B99BD3|nr:MATE family efflux transporter [Niveispirillum sp. BGYR6]MDG5497518.1 MATE family efflux transporter [Niveispirillum sp. BGYR6]